MNPAGNFNNAPLNSADLERNVLGAMMTNPTNLRDALGLLRGGEAVFYHLPNKLLFRAMRSLHADGIGVDYVTLRQRLAAHKVREEQVRSEYVRSLLTHTAYGATIDDYCKLMMGLWAKRQVGEIMTVLVQASYDPSTDANELLAEAHTKMMQVGQGLQVKGPTLLGEHLDEVGAAILRAASSPGGLTGVPSGLRSVDKTTGGWQPSDLIIIAARPGVGKTSFALACAEKAATAGHPGAIFNLEMNNHQMALKVVATEVKEYSTSQLRRGLFSGRVDEAKTVPPRYERLRNLQIWLDDTPGLSISEFRSKAARLKADHNIEWIVVDYLQLMTGDVKGNREQEIASISRGLKLTAKELNIPVLALSQLSRQVEGRGGDKKPMLSDLRESGSIEQDADAVVFLYRPEYYKITQDEMGDSVKDTTSVIFAKHRNGALDEVVVGSTMMNGHYFDLEDNSIFTPAPEPALEQPTEHFGPRILGRSDIRTSTHDEFRDDGNAA
jgi:replicative DNA helicase